jgi:hypothetical protein
MYTEAKSQGMTDGRSLLTERERKILSGEADVSDNYRYKVESTARQRVRRMAPDVAVLKKHHPKILAELREVVCEDDDK